MSEIIESQYWTKKINMAAQSVTVLIGAGIALVSMYCLVMAMGRGQDWNIGRLISGVILLGFSYLSITLLPLVVNFVFVRKLKETAAKILILSGSVYYGGLFIYTIDSVGLIGKNIFILYAIVPMSFPVLFPIWICSLILEKIQAVTTKKRKETKINRKGK